MPAGGRDCAKEAGATRTRMRVGSDARVTENASSGMDKIVDRITHGAVSRPLADATDRRGAAEKEAAWGSGFDSQDRLEKRRFLSPTDLD